MMISLLLLLSIVGCKDKDQTATISKANFMLKGSSLQQYNTSQVPTDMDRLMLNFNQQVADAEVVVQENGQQLTGVKVIKLGDKLELSNLKLDNFKVYNVKLTAKNQSGEQITSQVQFMTEMEGQLKKNNPTMMQTFYWSLMTPTSFWNYLADNVPELAENGITSLWLPPANKCSEPTSAGYKPYDLWDLGEFDQAGGQATKYGTREELEEALTTIHDSGMKAYYDVVFNHRFAPGNDNLEYSPLMGGDKVHSYTNLPNMKGREKYYSKDKEWDWNWKQFDAVDYDADTGQMEPILFKGKHWDESFGKDFLMAADVDFQNEKVIDEMKEWGTWVSEDVGFNGFRMDASKHISSKFTGEWIEHVQANTQEDLFFVGEAWETNVNRLKSYLDSVGNSDLKVFDFPLRQAFEELRDGTLDMRELAERGLVNQGQYHEQAVTFVDNHDTDRKQGGYTRPVSARTYQAYTYILMHEHGVPTVYWKDYYTEDMKQGINKLLTLRQKFAYGDGKVCAGTDEETFVYLREGKDDVWQSGLVELITKRDVTGETAQPVEVEFTFEPEGNPDSVTLAGGFNGWNKEANPMKDENNDGIYKLSLELPPGEWPYKYVVDGDNWIEPPEAEEYVDDGYGGKNGLLVVEGKENDQSDKKKIITKTVQTNKPNTAFVDYTGNMPGIITTDSEGKAEFKVKGSASQGWSVWVPIYKN